MGIIGEQEKTEVISEKSFIGTLILGVIPIVGTVLLIKWANSSEVRETKQNLCKALIKVKLGLMLPILITVGIMSWLLGSI